MQVISELEGTTQEQQSGIIRSVGAVSVRESRLVSTLAPLRWRRGWFEKLLG